MLKNFIHFGCWNNGGCQPDTTNDLWRVMKRLKEFVPKPSFIVVAGDNYYPTKTVVDKKKQKRLYTDKFRNWANNQRSKRENVHANLNGNLYCEYIKCGQLQYKFKTISRNPIQFHDSNNYD